jgi:hypothetical protein
MDCAKSKDINELFRMFYRDVWNNIPNKLKGDKKRRPDGRRKSCRMKVRRLSGIAR